MSHTHTQKDDEIKSKHNTGEKENIKQTLTHSRLCSHSRKTLTGQGYSDVQCLTIRLSHAIITTEMLENLIFESIN